jgi:hypothetical protein
MKVTNTFEARGINNDMPHTSLCIISNGWSTFGVWVGNGKILLLYPAKIIFKLNNAKRW